jgi:hypothetical protein
LDAAGPQPDQSIIVGPAEFDPGYPSGQFVCQDFSGFKVAVLVLVVQEDVLLEKPLGASTTFVVPLGLLSMFLLAKLVAHILLGSMYRSR